MSTALKLVTAATPAGDALRRNSETIADLTRQKAEAQAAVNRANEATLEHQAALATLGTLRARLKSARADKYLGRVPQTPIPALEREIDAAELEVEALASTAEGAAAAIEELSERVAAIDRQIAAAESRLTELRHAALRERLDGIRPRYAKAIDDLLAVYCEVLALGQAGDELVFQAQLKGPLTAIMPPLVVGLPRVLTLPVPLNLPAFDVLARPRDIRAQVDSGAKAILAELQ
jgi:hypothetical protein